MNLLDGQWTSVWKLAGLKAATAYFLVHVTGYTLPGSLCLRVSLQVEEQKRRAEADKLAAITALEQRSRDFMAEKEANRRLAERIKSMQSQLLTGGAALQDSAAFKCRVPPPFSLTSPPQHRVASHPDSSAAQAEVAHRSIAVPAVLPRT